MRKKTSLKDIAQLAGVSTALVSYVLNDRKEKKVGKVIAEKIREVARELNYQTNQLAKSLKLSKTHTIGLIVSNIANPFFSGLARIIEDEAEKQKYTVLFGSSDDKPERARKLIDTFLNRQVDGLIIALPEQANTLVPYLQAQNVPFVLVDSYFPDYQTNYVAIDNFQSMYDGVSHLIEQGRSRIGMITYETSLFHLHERQRGYEEALHDHRVSTSPEYLQYVHHATIQQDVERALDQLLSQRTPVDALIFASNPIALHALRYLKSHAIQIPEEIALVSFDQAEAFDLFPVSLSYIKQPISEMGRLATQYLLQGMDDSQSIQQVNLSTELVIQDSSKGVPAYMHG